MPITFPRAMPLAGVARQRFEVQRFDYVSPAADGRVGAISGGAPLWTATWTTGVGRDGAEEWRAFAASLRGPQRLFLGRDLERPYPAAYIAGDGVNWPAGFFGEATSWSVNTERDVLTLGLPSGFIITRNDYAGFHWSTGGSARRTIVRSLETAVAASNSVSFAIDPPLPTLVPSDGSAGVNLEKPSCFMRQTPDTEVGDQDRRRTVSTKLSAVQVLLP